MEDPDLHLVVEGQDPIRAVVVDTVGEVAVAATVAVAAMEEAASAAAALAGIAWYLGFLVPARVPISLPHSKKGRPR